MRNLQTRSDRLRTVAQRAKSKRGPKGDFVARWRGPKDATGKRVYHSKSGFRLQSEADAYRDRMVGHTASNVRELSDAFLRAYPWKSAGRKESVKYGLAKLKLAFDHRQAETITLVELQEWRQSLDASQWNTVQAAKQMFAWAERAGLIASNPALHLANPQPHANEVKAFRDGEVEAVATALGREYGRIARFVAETGLRVGEWLALEWNDIDRSNAKAPFVRVERRLAPDFTLAPPKTRLSRRRVPLTKAALAALDDVPAKHSKLVFPGAHSYIKIRPWRRDHWNPALAECGLAERPPTALRHTYATNRLRQGTPTFTVARRMGTSVQMLERTYGHHAEDSIEWELSLADARHVDGDSDDE